MKNNLIRLIIASAGAAGLLAEQPVLAAGTLTYDNTVTAINGHGNPDGFWNSYLDTSLNLQLSLRAQTTIIGTIPTSPNDGNGTFVFPVGNAPSSSKSTWNYWFSVNTNPSGLGANNLNVYDFYLTFDTPANPGVYFTPVNIMTAFNDNAYGNDATANSAGTIGSASTSPNLALTDNVAQNAENISFSGLPVTLTGNYDFQLYAVAAGTGADGTRVGEVDMTVQVVPEPATLALTGLGFTGLLLIQRQRRKM